MEPSEAYQPVMAAMQEKTYLSKVVIELCEEDPAASYEDLLNRIEVRHRYEFLDGTLHYL